MSNARRLSWDARHGVGPVLDGRPEPFLLANADLIRSGGRAIDVAGGPGFTACWMAARGLDVTLADWSVVALRRATRRADGAGQALRTVAVDLEQAPFPDGPWDLIFCARFLHRPLFEDFPIALAPGGLLVVVHPTVSNLERHDRPGRRHLLEDGELPGLVRRLQILRAEEGWGENGRHEAKIIARREGPP